MSGEDKKDGIPQVVTNLVKFSSDPDLLWFDNSTNQVINQQAENLTQLMAAVSVNFGLGFLAFKS